MTFCCLFQRVYRKLRNLFVLPILCKQTSVKRTLYSSYGGRNMGTEGKIQILRLLLNVSSDLLPFPQVKLGLNVCRKAQNSTIPEIWVQKFGLSSFLSLALDAKNCPNASHESIRRVHTEPRENTERCLPAGDFFLYAGKNSQR